MSGGGGSNSDVGHRSSSPTTNSSASPRDLGGSGGSGGQSVSYTETNNYLSGFSRSTSPLNLRSSHNMMRSSHGFLLSSLPHL